MPVSTETLQRYASGAPVSFGDVADMAAELVDLRRLRSVQLPSDDAFAELMADKNDALRRLESMQATQADAAALRVERNALLVEVERLASRHRDDMKAIAAQRAAEREVMQQAIAARSRVADAARAEADAIKGEHEKVVQRIQDAADEARRQRDAAVEIGRNATRGQVSIAELQAQFETQRRNHEQAIAAARRALEAVTKDRDAAREGWEREAAQLRGVVAGVQAGREHDAADHAKALEELRAERDAATSAKEQALAEHARIVPALRSAADRAAAEALKLAAENVQLRATLGTTKADRDERLDWMRKAAPLVGAVELWVRNHYHKALKDAYERFRLAP